MGNLPQARVVRGDVNVQLGPAPRRVPARLTWRLLFGTNGAMFGWGFAAFGMIFVLLFGPKAELFTPSYDRTATATITRVEASGASENDDPIYRVHYEFTDQAGVLRRGASYTRDRDVAGSRDVAYVAADPARSRLAGLRTREFSWWIVVVVLVFPLGGLAVALPQLRTGLRNRRLLATGVQTVGRLVHKEATGTEVNGTEVMALTFEYQAGGAPARVTVKLLHPAPLEDDPLEPMLYDPAAPGRATPLDHLPGAPLIGADGALVSSPGFAAHVLVLPAMFVGEVIAAIILMRG